MKKEGRRSQSKGKGERVPSEGAVKKVQNEKNEIKELTQRIAIECPAPGKQWTPPSVSILQETLQNKAASTKGNIKLTNRHFSDLPVSKKTLQGLKSSGFTLMSEIQKAAIPHALCSRDVLGEAQTGSGKTLAFLIPLIECLYRDLYTSEDGLGALILTPTRELAVQIFEVLKNVGRFHDMSAGCIIGGKDLESEKSRLDSLNIIIGTPGRILQHMDESILWNAANLKVLVLDEADRMLDMGFEATMCNIIDSLPPPSSRQTMLFSATLHSAISILKKRQNILRPVYERIVIAGSNHDSGVTPSNLNQLYVTLPLENKVDSLFSFLKCHSKKKIVVFVNTCKQVRYYYETMRLLKPGLMILSLYGKQSQHKRLDMINTFINRQDSVCLICTDIVSRGIDFPSIDWVIQLDCPESVDTYIHRVGRTARFNNKGEGLLFLLPQEETFLRRLDLKRIPIKKIALNPKKQMMLKNKLSSLMAENPELKVIAQKSFISYLRSILMMGDKEVFSVVALDWKAYALSLGLVQIPLINIPGITIGLNNDENENSACNFDSSLLPNSFTADSEDEELALYQGGNMQQDGKGREESQNKQNKNVNGKNNILVELESKNFNMETNNPMKQLKNLSKLDKLKMKIQQKKQERMQIAKAAVEDATDDHSDEEQAESAAEEKKSLPIAEKKTAEKKGKKEADDAKERSILDKIMQMRQKELDEFEKELLSDIENEKERKNKKNKKLEKIRSMKNNFHQESEEEEAGEDDFLKVKKGNLDEMEKVLMEENQRFRETQFQLAKKQKIKIKKDGTAKVPGVPMNTNGQVFFDSDEEGQKEDEESEQRVQVTELKSMSKFEALVKKSKGEEEARKGKKDNYSSDESSSRNSDGERSESEEDEDVQNKHEYVELVKRRLAKRKRTNDELAKERVQSLHKRRKEKLKALNTVSYF